MDLAPFDLAPEGEAGFGPAEMGRQSLPGEVGGQGKMSVLTRLTAREGSRFLEFRVHREKAVWKGKEGT